MDFNGSRSYIIHRLKTELDPSLYYHSVEHTLDVHEATQRLTESENVSGKEKILLETAALYHDCGMLIRYQDHESASCELARKVLPGFGYSLTETEKVCTLIMSTKMPQQAVNLPEQILCDADLDYLGRDDFFIHSFQLRLEWQIHDIKHMNLRAWLESQVEFLTGHRYFTRSAFSQRHVSKIRNLDEILTLLHQEQH